MKKSILALATGLCITAGPPAFSATFVMDFEGLGPNPPTDAVADGVSYSEDGMTMTRAFTHFDRYRNNPVLSPDPTNHNPVIHEGNGGAGVNFSMGGTAFDLLSLDILGWVFGAQPVVTSTSVTISSSGGGNHVLNATSAGPNPSGLLDFTALAGFANITSFSLLMPNHNTVCFQGNNCPNFGFDNVTFRTPPGTGPAPIPLPAGLPLLLTGLGALGLARLGRRKLA